MKVGPRIRELRKEQGITLVALAASADVDAATLSRIENSKMTGTIESHMQLCHALGVPLSQLYGSVDGSDDRVQVHSQRDAAEVFHHHSGRSSLQLLTSDVMKKKMMPALVHIQPGGKTHPERTRSGTEKFVYVLSGPIEANIDKKISVLRKGDSIYFDGALPHTLRNLGQREGRCLVVTTPPVL